MPRAHCFGLDAGVSTCTAGIPENTAITAFDVVAQHISTNPQLDFTPVTSGVDSTPASGTGAAGGVVVIGDVNRDGTNDIAFVMNEQGSADSRVVVALVGTMSNVDSKMTALSLTSFALSDLDVAHQNFQNTVDNIMSLTAVGDVNGDGVPDIGFVAPNWVNGAGPHGGIFIVNLGIDGEVVDHSVIAPAIGGWSLVAGDFSSSPSGNVQAGFSGLGYLGNADGDANNKPEIIVASIEYTLISAGAQYTGTVWVLSLNADGTVADYYSLDTPMVCGSLANTGKCGTSIAVLGDVDFNEVPDIAVSGTSGGEFAVVRLDVNPSLGQLFVLARTVTNLATPNTPIPAGHSAFTADFATRVFAAGDANNDGIGDIFVASPAEATSGGMLELYLLGVDGSATKRWWYAEGTSFNQPAAGAPAWHTSNLGFASSVAVYQHGTQTDRSTVIVGVPNFSSTGCDACGDFLLLRYYGCGSTTIPSFPIRPHDCDTPGHHYPGGLVP
jgi:hypothetical protein